MPYGFFHHPMEGLSDGYPVLVSSAISMRRALQTLQYIQYGGFLNGEATDTLTLKMVLYNPAAVVFGYFSAVLEWMASGEILMTVAMQVSRPHSFMLLADSSLEHTWFIPWSSGSQRLACSSKRMPSPQTRPHLTLSGAPRCRVQQ